MEPLYAIIAILMLLVVTVLLLFSGRLVPDTKLSLFGKILVIIVVGTMFLTANYAVGYAMIGAIGLLMILDYIDRR